MCRTRVPAAAAAAVASSRWRHWWQQRQRRQWQVPTLPISLSADLPAINANPNALHAQRERLGRVLKARLQPVHLHALRGRRLQSCLVPLILHLRPQSPGGSAQRMQCGGLQQKLLRKLMSLFQNKLTEDQNCRGNETLGTVKSHRTLPSRRRGAARRGAAQHSTAQRCCSAE